MSSDKVDFLYQQERADPEKFLLGRKIEKTEHLNTFTSAAAATSGLGGVEGLERQSIRTELQQAASGGTMSAEEIEAQRISIDMQAKMRDDPLFLIRKREEDDKREMLKNPLKMRQLQTMMKLVSAKKQAPAMASIAQGGGDDDDGDNLLKQYLNILRQKNEEKAKKASKLIASKSDDKHSRNRQRRRSRSRSSSSSTSSSSSADSLLEGYMNALKQKQSLVTKMKTEEREAELMERKEQLRKERQKLQPGGGISSSDEEHERGSNESSPVSKRRPAPKNYQRRPEPRAPKQEDRNRGRYYDKQEKDYSQQHHREDRSSYYDNRQRDRSDRNPSHFRSRQRSRSPRESRRSPHDDRRDRGAAYPPKPRKLSPASMERRRQEMLDAGRERNTERVSNVRRYEEEERKELAVEEEMRNKKASFLRGTMLDHASRSSVGDRVQRNKFNMQRRSDDLVSGGEKFLKR